MHLTPHPFLTALPGGDKTSSKVAHEVCFIGRRGRERETESNESKTTWVGHTGDPCACRLY
eukprot:scaffold34594_cov165-Amphora_coffeaeformis.AAC.4